MKVTVTDTEARALLALIRDQRDADGGEPGSTGAALGDVALLIEGELPADPPPPCANCNWDDGAALILCELCTAEGVKAFADPDTAHAFMRDLATNAAGWGNPGVDRLAAYILLRNPNA